MQVDFKSPSSHFWITAFWCALGAIILGAIAVISCWIRKCRIQRANQNSHNNNIRQTTQNIKDREVYKNKTKNKSTHKSYNDKSCIYKKGIRYCKNTILANINSHTNSSYSYSNNGCFQNFCFSNKINITHIRILTYLHRNIVVTCSKEIQYLYQQHYPNQKYK